MKVTSEDIRNLAEALQYVKKFMPYSEAYSDLTDCIKLATEDFKKRLLYEEEDDDEYCTMDEVIEERDRMNELADCVRKVTDLVKELDVGIRYEDAKTGETTRIVRIPANEETDDD